MPKVQVTVELDHERLPAFADFFSSFVGGGLAGPEVNAAPAPSNIADVPVLKVVGDEEPAANITPDDIRQAMLAHQKANDTPATLKVLKEITGATRVKDVDVKDYPALFYTLKG